MPDLALDYSAGPPAAVALKTAGARAAGRYIAPRRADGSRRPKCLTPAERDDLLAHGVDIFLVFEDDTGNALKGAAQGDRDGQVAAEEAAALHAPMGMTLYAAVDTDTTFAKARQYLAAFRKAVLSRGYAFGVYGGYSVVAPALSARVAERGWLTQAWLYGRDPTKAGAALYQHARTMTVDGVVCDVNDILKPDYGGWLAAQAPEAEMPLSDDDKKWLAEHLMPRKMDDPTTAEGFVDVTEVIHSMARNLAGVPAAIAKVAAAKGVALPSDFAAEVVAELGAAITTGAKQ